MQQVNSFQLLHGLLELTLLKVACQVDTHVLSDGEATLFLRFHSRILEFPLVTYAVFNIILTGTKTAREAL